MLPLLIAIFLGQHTYFGPTSPPPPQTPRLVQVQVELYDEKELGGLTIEKASFAGYDIPLKPSDVFGFRGKGGFQLPVGTYPIAWTVRKQRLIYPRTVSYKKTVTVKPLDQWIEVVITGSSMVVQ